MRRNSLFRVKVRSIARRIVVLAALSFVILACSTAPDERNAGPTADSGRSEELALGKLIYDTHCARCHGVDGKSDTYPFILTLDGIGKRYTLDQILEETWATGFVAPQQFSPEERRAMARYVATL